MRQLAPLSLALALAPPALAAQYDYKGDLLRVNSGGGAFPPGQVLDSIDHGGPGTDGLALFSTGNLLYAFDDGISAVFEIDATGAVVNTFPVQDPEDTFLGYDASRDLILTANAFSDRIKGYTPGNAVPVFDAPSPGVSAVGIAWDPTRDEYVISDWWLNAVFVLDADTLAVTRMFTLNSLHRMIGVTYDCVDDTYVVGDRGTRAHYVLDPTTGAILASWPTAGGVTSNLPRGTTMSSRSGVWTGVWGSGLLLEMEAHHPTTASPCPTAIGTPYCGPAVPNSTGTPSSISAIGSAVAAHNDVTLTAYDLPTSAFGFFVTSRTQGFVMNPGGSAGNLCLAGSIGRYVGPGQIQSSGASGAFSLTLDLTQTPTPSGFVAVASGETWNYQAWHRDSGAMGPTSNFTNGLSIPFL